MEQPNVCGITIEPVPAEFSAENMIAPYFPRLSAGVLVNKKLCKLVKNNTENIYEIDWAISIDGISSAWIDVEHKQHGWGYPELSVAIYTMKYNQGKSDYKYLTSKVKVFRAKPMVSFWMPIRLDYQEAGIIVAQEIIDSPIIERQQARGMARPILVYSFSSSRVVFSGPYTHTIEDYIFENLHKAGVL